MKESSQKHTPGPWISTYGGQRIEPDTGRPENAICVLYDGHGHCREESQEANARLIAAAPELLAVCLAIKEWAETRHECGHNPHVMPQSRFKRDLDAAIAKATGLAQLGGK